MGWMVLTRAGERLPPDMPLAAASSPLAGIAPASIAATRPDIFAVYLTARMISPRSGCTSVRVPAINAELALARADDNAFTARVLRRAIGGSPSENNFGWRRNTSVTGDACARRSTHLRRSAAIEPPNSVGAPSTPLERARETNLGTSRGAVRPWVEPMTGRTGERGKRLREVARISKNNNLQEQ